MLLLNAILVFTIFSPSSRASAPDSSALERELTAVQMAYSSEQSDLFSKLYGSLLKTYQERGLVQDEIWLLKSFGHHTSGNLLEKRAFTTLMNGPVVKIEPFAPNPSLQQITFAEGWKAQFKPCRSLCERAEEDLLRFEIDHSLGFNLIPLTVVRQIHGQIGALQMRTLVTNPFSTMEKLQVFNFVTSPLTPDHSSAEPPKHLGAFARKAVEKLKADLLSPASRIFQALEPSLRALIQDQIDTLLKLPLSSGCESQLTRKSD